MTLSFFPFPKSVAPTTPIADGCLRLKRTLGTSWAGQILNNFQEAGAMTGTGLFLRSQPQLTHSPLGNGILFGIHRTQDWKLYVYSDASALIVHANTARVLPLPLYLPTTVTMDGKKRTFALIDWLEPTESPFLDLDTAYAIRAQLDATILAWAALADPIRFDKTQQTLTAWFLPLHTVDTETKTRLEGLLCALKAASPYPNVSLSLTGRAVEANGALTPLRFVVHNQVSWWTSRVKPFERLFNNPALDIAPTATISQGYKLRRPGSWVVTGWGGRTIATDKNPPQSAHETLHHTRLLQRLLTDQRISL